MRVWEEAMGGGLIFMMGAMFGSMCTTMILFMYVIVVFHDKLREMEIREAEKKRGAEHWQSRE